MEGKTKPQNYTLMTAWGKKWGLLFSRARNGLGLGVAARLAAEPGLGVAAGVAGVAGVPGPSALCTQRAAETSAEVTDSGKTGNPAGELGTPREFWAASPGVRADQKVNVSELSLPEFWGISCGKPRAKGQRTRPCTETAACCSPGNRRQECGRRPFPPSLLLPLPFTSFSAIFLATPYHLPVSSQLF